MTTQVLNPKTSLSIIGAADIVSVKDRRVLIVGQQLTGSALDGALTENVNSLTVAQINALFGQGSLVAEMIRRAKAVLKGIATQPQIDVIGLADDGGATDATAVITFTGPATEAGTILISIGSKADYTFEVAVTDTDTETIIGDTLAALVAADLDAPFLAANVAGVVTFTAKNGGTVPNTWGIGFDGVVAGVITVLTTEWSSGAGDPVLTSIFDVIEDIRETTVIWPEAYTLADLATELDSRFNVADAVLDGVGIVVIADTTANLKSAVASLNSQSIVVFGNTYDVAGGFSNKKGPGVFEFSDIIATEIGIIRALRLTDDAPITNFINASGSALDAFGGIHISSKPYHNTLLPGIAVPDPGEYFDQTEQADLIDNAISVFGANRSSNSVVLGTVVTTYLTDTAGNPDTSFKFLNTIDQVSIIREFYVVNLLSRYSQSRLTDGVISAGFAIENEDSIKGFCVQLFQELSENLIVQSGNVALKDYKQNLSVVVDVGNGKVTINQAPLLVGQIRTIIGTIQVNFG